MTLLVRPYQALSTCRRAGHCRTLDSREVALGFKQPATDLLSTSETQPAGSGCMLTLLAQGDVP